MMRVLLLSLVVCVGVAGAQAPKKSHFWFRCYPDLMVKYDPVSDKEVGRVKTVNGLLWGSYLSHDHKRIMVTTGKRAILEEIDLEKMEVIDTHDFAENGYIVRIGSVKECPGGKKWYVRRDRIKINVDTFEMLDPEWLLYNREVSEIEKKMKELPRAIRSGARISPCGTKWHVFASGNIKIVDPETLKDEGEIDLKTPRYTGMGPISVRGTDLFNHRNPDAYRLVYSMRDPVKTSRTIYGLVDVSIKEKKVTKITEWGWAPSSSSWRLSRDGKRGIASAGRGGRGNLAGDPSVNLVLWDMEKGKKLAEKRSIVRNGLALAAFSPDGTKAYLIGRGHEFWVFDENLDHVKTVEMPGEILRGGIHVVDG